MPVKPSIIRSRFRGDWLIAPSPLMFVAPRSRLPPVYRRRRGASCYVAAMLCRLYALTGAITALLGSRRARSQVSRDALLEEPAFSSRLAARAARGDGVPPAVDIYTPAQATAVLSRRTHRYNFDESPFTD